MIPLTHHDVVRFAAPLVRAGLAIDLAASDRAARRIAFRRRVVDVGSPGDDPSTGLPVLHELTVRADGSMELSRAVAHTGSGLVATLGAHGSDAGALIDAFDRIPPAGQIVRENGFVIAESWTLTLDDPRDADTARPALQHVVGQAGALVLLVDVSSGAGMPATALLASASDWTDHLREALACGVVAPQRQPLAARLIASLPDRAGRSSDPAWGNACVALMTALPDDVLAVLGPSWRPLTWQGDRWKTVLRLLGHEPGRSERASARIREALTHLAIVTSESPAHYHARHATARRQVFVRRLRPWMVLGAILAVMPISWFFVARGGVRMHPMALGLTPLLMVGVVLMSAHEIPVMELPPLPRALPDSRWTPLDAMDGAT